MWSVHKLESILSIFLSWGTSLVPYVVEFSITNVTLEAPFLCLLGHQQPRLQLDHRPPPGPRCLRRRGRARKFKILLFLFFLIDYRTQCCALTPMPFGGAVRGAAGCGQSATSANAVAKWQSRTRDKQNVTWVLWSAEICGVAATVTSRPQRSLWSLAHAATLWPAHAWNPLSFLISPPPLLFDTYFFFLKKVHNF